MTTPRQQPRNRKEITIRLGKQDLAEVREICDTVSSLYELLRDRDDSIPVAYLLRPTVRALSRLVESLEDRLNGARRTNPIRIALAREVPAEGVPTILEEITAAHPHTAAMNNRRADAERSNDPGQLRLRPWHAVRPGAPLIVGQGADNCFTR